MPWLNALKGYRTYVISAVIFVLGGLQALGFHIPAEVTALLSGLGLLAARAKYTDSQ